MHTRTRIVWIRKAIYQKVHTAADEREIWPERGAEVNYKGAGGNTRIRRKAARKLSHGSFGND